MTPSRKLLTFELSPSKDEIDIHCDVQGLQDFIGYLQRLANGKSDLPRHDHLMTAEWSGTELTSEKQGLESDLINKVTIRLWKK